MNLRAFPINALGLDPKKLGSRMWSDALRFTWLVKEELDFET